MYLELPLTNQIPAYATTTLLPFSCLAQTELETHPSSARGKSVSHGRVMTSHQHWSQRGLGKAAPLLELRGHLQTKGDAGTAQPPARLGRVGPCPHMVSLSPSKGSTVTCKSGWDGASLTQRNSKGEKEENNKMDSGGSTTSTTSWFPTKFIPSKEQTGTESHSWRYMHGSMARGSLYVHTFKYNNWARIILIKKCVACTWPPNEPWYWVLDSHSVLEKPYK